MLILDGGGQDQPRELVGAHLECVRGAITEPGPTGRRLDRQREVSHLNDIHGRDATGHGH